MGVLRVVRLAFALRIALKLWATGPLAQGKVDDCSLRDEETSARQALSIVLREQTDFFKAPQHLFGGKEAQLVYLSRVANSTGPVDLIVEPEARQTVLDLSLAHPNDP